MTPPPSRPLQTRLLPLLLLCFTALSTTHAYGVAIPTRQSPPPRADRHRRRHRRRNRRQPQLQQQQLPADVSTWATIYTDVAALQRQFGQEPLDAVAARQLYHELLPVGLWQVYERTRKQQQQALSPNTVSITTTTSPTTTTTNVTQLAYAAFCARRAAKLYVRTRLPVGPRVACHVVDGLRTWHVTGAFDPTGLSFSDLRHKYSSADDIDDDAVAATILQGACRSNRHVDNWCESEAQKNEHGLSEAELRTMKAQVRADVERWLRVALEDDDDDENHTEDFRNYRRARRAVRVRRVLQRLRL